MITFHESGECQPNHFPGMSGDVTGGAGISGILFSVLVWVKRGVLSEMSSLRISSMISNQTPLRSYERFRMNLQNFAKTLENYLGSSLIPKM